MATEIVMPQMGAEMEEGTVVKWLKQPGDQVNKGDVLAEIETDKATVELDTFESGTFLKAIVDEGATVPVGEVIAYLGEPGEQVPDAPARSQDGGANAGANGSTPSASSAEAPDGRANDGTSAAEPAPTSAPVVSESMRAERTTNAQDATQPAQPEARPTDGTQTAPAQPERQPATVGPRDSLTRDGARIRASPVARSMAEEMGVDLTLIRGTGPEGRITRRDVEEFAHNRAAFQVHGAEGRAPVEPEPAPRRPAAPAQVQTAAAQPSAAPATTAPAPARPTAAPPAPAPRPAAEAAPSGAGKPAPQESDEVEPLTRMRQAIARRMATAKREAPHYYVAVSVDMTEALRMRKELNAQLPEADHIPISPMIVKACAIALEHQPHFNATFTDQGITVHHDINIGLAVALDDGLVVPAILNCRGKSLGALAREGRDVAERARNGRLKPAELNDGTFTVSNLGMYGVELLVAIIQPGQAAILGVGNVEERPVVHEGQVVARSMMTIALSADHRVTDGAEGAKFIAEIKELLEHPARLVL